MARFDVYRSRTAPATYLLDCQADLLSGLNTRFVVPLMSLEQAPKPAGRLNPGLAIEGRQVVMVTQFAAAILVAELGELVMSLQDDNSVLIGALDMLISGV